MPLIFFCLIIFSLICLVVGLIKPSLVLSPLRIKKEQQSRKKVLTYFLFSALLFFLYFGLAVQPTITIFGYIRVTLFLALFLASLKPKFRRWIRSKFPTETSVVKILVISILLLFFANAIAQNVVIPIYKELNKPSEQREAERQAKEELRRTQAEEKAEQQRIENEQKAQREEELRETLATEYCNERKNHNRLYLIGAINNDQDGNVNTESSKEGSELTQDDCRQIITAILIFKKVDLANPVSEEVMDIVLGKVGIGMHKGDLIYSIGLPDAANTSNYGYGIVEQWIYYKSRSAYNFSAYYIYLDGDKVTSYQDF